MYSIKPYPCCFQAWVYFYPTEDQQKTCNSCGDQGMNGDLVIVYDVKRDTSLGDVKVHQEFISYQKHSLKLKLQAESNGPLKPPPSAPPWRTPSIWPHTEFSCHLQKQKFYINLNNIHLDWIWKWGLTLENFNIPHCTGGQANVIILLLRNHYKHLTTWRWS